MQLKKTLNFFSRLRQQGGIELKHSTWYQILISLYLLSALLWTLIGDNNTYYIINMASSTVIGIITLVIAILFLGFRGERLAMLLFFFFCSISLYFGGQCILLYVYRHDYKSPMLSLLIAVLKFPLAITSVLLGVYIWKGKKTAN